jgi:hypothetical protein
VPASYCGGVIGWPLTHGSVPDSGVVHLALVVRHRRRADPPPHAADRRRRCAARGAIRIGTGDVHRPGQGDRRRLGRRTEAFPLIQGYEAWVEHGEWITHAQPDFARDIAERFAAASWITADDVKLALRCA